MSLPTASILIPTHGRSVELARCLAALHGEVAAHGRAEVLTVHAPGDQTSEAMVESRFGGWVRVTRAAQRNLSLQRNLGARCAHGDVVVYLDDDAWPTPGWLAALLTPLRDATVAAVGGRVLRGDGSLQYGAMAVTPRARPFRLAEDAEPPPGTARTLPGGNLAVRREVLFALGGFDENIAYHFDDVEFSLRLAAAGHRSVYHPGACIHHEPAPGPHRRTSWDRDWRTIASNSVYVALRHTPPGQRGRWLVPALLQVPKSVRFVAWLCRGRLGPGGFVRALLGQWAGVAAGYRRGVALRPGLPLRPSAPPEPAPACSAAETSCNRV